MNDRSLDCPRCCKCADYTITYPHYEDPANAQIPNKAWDQLCYVVLKCTNCSYQTTLLGVLGSLSPAGYAVLVKDR